MKFNYQARTKTGKVQVGTVEAASEEGALMLLQRHGLYVTHLESVEELPFWLKKIDLRRVSRKDLVMFSRQLSIMFESQVPLVEALRTLAEQSEKPRFREILTDISEKIEGGTSFSQALAAYPELFNPFFINMVKSGESSGKLAESLSYLAEHIEREYELSAKIKGAMIYPIIIVCMMAGIGILMSVYVLPQLLVILQETGQELPFITRAIISGVEFIRSWGGVALIIGFFSYQNHCSKNRREKIRIFLKSRRNLLSFSYILGGFLNCFFIANITYHASGNLESFSNRQSS